MKLSFIFACLSPETMYISTQIGYYSAAFCIAIAIALLFHNARHRDFSWMILYGPLLIVHPAWTIGVYSGDCGLSKRFFSVAVSAVFVGLLACLVFASQPSKRRFLFWLSAISWIVYVAARLRELFALEIAPPSPEDKWAQFLFIFTAASYQLMRPALLLTFIYFAVWLVTRKRAVTVAADS